jgi:hypothetical protein
LEDNSEKLRIFLKKELPKIADKTYNYFRLYYERALEYNCDDEEIWAHYIGTIKKLFKNKDLLLNVLKRACKCCYFHVQFWVLFLREMEKQNFPIEEIRSKYIKNLLN